MDDSLILSHLPAKFAYHKCLDLLRTQTTPPTLKQLDALFTNAGEDLLEIATHLNHAKNEAGLTEKIKKELDIFSVHYWSPQFPQSLKEIPNPPWNLFFRGRLPQNNCSLGIVGTRKPSTYGESVLAHILPLIQTRPLQIISGLAYGIDSIAHQIACEINIPNFAVLGCGIDQIYPAAHYPLALRIIKQGGGILSELPPGTPPHSFQFPKRNRIISGLSDLIWVVQGNAKSGSLHTVKHALDQAKIISTTPGEIFCSLSDLPHRLLFEGAHPIVRAEDLDLLLKGSSTKVIH